MGPWGRQCPTARAVTSLVYLGLLVVPVAGLVFYSDIGDDYDRNIENAERWAQEAVAKLSFEGTAQYHQAGIMVYGDDANFTKFGRIAHFHPHKCFIPVEGLKLPLAAVRRRSAFELHIRRISVRDG